MIGHIFDIDVLITIDSKPWVIDKNNPNIPLLKLSKSDFNLIKNGVYKSQGNKLEYNGKTFWLPNVLFNKIKVIAKNKKIGITDIAISMQEFLNKDVIENVKYDINYDAISHLKNKSEDVYLICSINTERNYKIMIDRLLEKLADEGILIKKFYYLNETFYNGNNDNVIFKKGTICLQHLVGYEIKNEVFIDKTINKYSKLYFYDDDFDTLKITSEINSFLSTILSKTEIGLKEVVKEDIVDDSAILIVNKIASNKYNKFITSEVKLSLSTVKKFENFKPKI
jgi:nitrogen regulatory protein PII-like uncharacterized protein